MYFLFSFQNVYKLNCSAKLGYSGTCARLCLLLLVGALLGACGGGVIGQGEDVSESASPADEVQNPISEPAAVLPHVCQTGFTFEREPRPAEGALQPTETPDGHLMRNDDGSVVIYYVLPYEAHTAFLYIRINESFIEIEPDILEIADGTYRYSSVLAKSGLETGDRIASRLVAVTEYTAADYYVKDTSNFTHFIPPLPARMEGVPFEMNWSDTLDYVDPLSSSDSHNFAAGFFSGYVQQLANGDVVFCHTTDFVDEARTSQLFFLINGQHYYGNPQIIPLEDGTYTHVDIQPAENFKDGDEIEVRFYVVDSGRGVFIPGPGFDEWSEPMVYRAGFGAASFIAMAAPSHTNSVEDWPLLQGAGSDAQITPLYGPEEVLEPAVVWDRGDAIVTRFSDRARDRHAREDDPDFQKYDHYLTQYWQHRTARYEIADFVTKGESKLEVKYITEWSLNATEFRAFYSGEGGTNSYHNGAGAYTKVGPVGRYDADFNFIDGKGTQRLYTVTLENFYGLRLDSDIPREEGVPLALGQYMEFESSLFLDNPPIGRDNYYATTFLYRIGLGGLVPWKTVGQFNPDSPHAFKPEDGERENSQAINEAAWLGGWTTLPYMHSGEPDNHFMQMATNISSINGQAFVLGRRLHHTHFDSGEHDENTGNLLFTEVKGLQGNHFINKACSSCHQRNGRALVPDIGEALTTWAFKIAGPDGASDPHRGDVLQPNNKTINPQSGEGRVTIVDWVSNASGLRQAKYGFETGEPAFYSARIAPQIVGMGLIDAIREADVLAREDEFDNDGDGISGKAQTVIDPISGVRRLGRFGYKAGAGSLRQQIAGALRNDMGVLTDIYPTPDCGGEQKNCGHASGRLANDYLDQLEKYIALLGVRPRRDRASTNAQAGERVFHDIGCESCHRESYTTSTYHPLAELRGQKISPYTDLLLHDMGAGLADNMGEGKASGAEWRTAPLWGLGHAKSVAEGTGDEYKTGFGYLHDGRARTINEAILWHGGEGQAANDRYQALGLAEKEALLFFLKTL